MPLPVPQPCCRMASKQSHYAARHAEIPPSKAAVPLLLPLRWVSHRLRRRPAHRSRRQPDRQIAIGGYSTIPRGFLPWRLSDAGPQCRLIDCKWAGIRNPSQKRTRKKKRPFLRLRTVGLNPDQQPVIGMRVLHASDQALKRRLINRDVTRLGLHNETRRFEAERAASGDNVDAGVRSRRRYMGLIALRAQDCGDQL